MILDTAGCDNKGWRQQITRWANEQGKRKEALVIQAMYLGSRRYAEALRGANHSIPKRLYAGFTAGFVTTQ